MSYEVEKNWVTEAGLRAVCILIKGSHRCGYVHVPEYHPLFGKHYLELSDIDVHGGLTYSSAGEKYPIQSEGWWFGFDCAHYMDGSLNPLLRNEHPVRTTEYVFHECESLAQQLAEMK